MHLGPGWYIERLDTKIEKGDTIQVTGSRVTFKGVPAIIAAQVKKDDAVLKLRDDNTMVRDAVAECERRAARQGIHGKAVTPFLLRCLAEVTGGASLETNLALLHSNATLAAQIAVAFAA